MRISVVLCPIDSSACERAGDAVASGAVRDAARFTLDEVAGASPARVQA
jgi:hypothetical protein